MEIPADGVQLNVGCGRHVLDGWVNVDVVASPRAKRRPEVIAKAKSIPLPDRSVIRLMGIHVWEHFYFWECEDVAREWHRLMRPGAELILEMPDLFKFCANILEARASRGHPDQLGMWGLYGDPRDKDPHMMHRWGWTFRTLAPYLEERGFTECKEEPTQWHAAGKDVRDFRLVARRR